jgi:hypothetical protein
MNQQSFKLDLLLNNLLAYCLWFNIFVFLLGLALVLFLLILEKLDIQKELRHFLLNLLIRTTDITAFTSAYVIFFVFSISVLS